MTDNEIREIARKYAEEEFNRFQEELDGIPLDKAEHTKAIAETAMEAFSYLLHDHCVVSKEKIEQVRKFVGSEGAQVAIYLLFGKEGEK